MARLLLKLTRWFVYTLSAVLLLTFSIANRELITLSLFPLPYEAELPKYFLGLGFFLLGVAVGCLFMGYSLLRSRTQLSAAVKRAKALENELAQLRTGSLATGSLPAQQSKYHGA